MQHARKPFRVLCLDGGGMRGLYSAALLDNLVQIIRGNNDYDAGKAFDLIVGTSTGGILATGLAYGCSLNEIIDLYRSYGPKIFTNPMPPPNPGIGLIGKLPQVPAWTNWLVHRRGAANSGQAALHQALKAKFEDETLEELYERRKIALCLPAVIMATRKSYVFKTPHIPAREGNHAKQRDNKYKLKDVCLSTAAAPIIFPMVAIDRPNDPQKHDVFVDGGLWANNPTLVGLIESLEITESKRDIQIISVSTASPPAGKVIREDLNPYLVGTKGWKFGVGALEASLDAQAWGTQNSVNFLLSHLKAKVDVVRLAYDAPSNEQAMHIGLDKADPDAIDALLDMAKADAENNILSKSSRHSPEQIQILQEIIKSMPIMFEGKERPAG